MEPVDFVDVYFTKAINPASFTFEDLELTRDNGTNLIEASVSISAISDRAFRVTGLRTLTATHGLYRFLVRVGTMVDTQVPGDLVNLQRIGFTRV